MEIELAMNENFNPSRHSIVPERRFHDFEIGEQFFAPSRTMTEGVFTTFQAASGDNHPCLLYTSPSPRDATLSRMPSSA